jgi:hypothetical protein
VGLASAVLISGCGGGGGSSATSNTTFPNQPPPPATIATSLFPSGSLDAVDQQSVRGWACNAGDPTTKLSVELWAIDASTGGWTYITTTNADKQQTDVGRTGVCGSGLESNYHGFEFAIYPDNMLNRNKAYSVYAYFRTTGQFLAGGGRAVGFPESGLPTSGYWRTDFDDLNLRSPALLSCIWPFLGANQRGDTNNDPLWIYTAATLDAPRAALLQFVTPSDWCITFDPVRANPPPPWAQSNSATNAPSWPTDNFWVVSANNEPAYSQLNSGPPNQSLPLNSGGVYSVSAAEGVFVLGADNTQKPKDSQGNVIVDGTPSSLSAQRWGEAARVRSRSSTPTARIRTWNSVRPRTSKSGPSIHIMQWSFSSRGCGAGQSA